MIQKYWGQPGCLCLHYIKRTNDGAPLPDSSAIFQRMKKGLCTNAYFSLTRQPLFFLKNKITGGVLKSPFFEDTAVSRRYRHVLFLYRHIF